MAKMPGVKTQDIWPYPVNDYKSDIPEEELLELLEEDDEPE